jgi:flagellar biosynthesis protein FlhA
VTRNVRIQQIATPIGVVAIVFLLVVPIPAALLDVLLALNISLTILVLLTTMAIRKPLDFSVFPSLVLVFTLFRLGLNVASTRLVLRDAYAGEVISAFGHFVVGGSIVIGLVIFLILVVIQFVVVTNGAGRSAEVGARFTLDAMPGKQMAIDADLNSGLIDEREARRRRAEVAAEADFYGAMDGGSKFVKGDAIAGIVITLINLIGGFVIGMVQKGMSASDALETYSMLTIGDGLVTQIPALLMSVSTGLVVTRASADEDMGTAAARQITQSRTAMTIAGAAALVIAIIPGIPRLPFIVVGALLLGGAQIAGRRDRQEAAEGQEPAPAAPPSPEQAAQALVEEMGVRPLEVLLAPDLVSLVRGDADNDLLGRIRLLRRKVALDLGLVMPPVRTRDSVDLPPSTYVIHLHGVEAARGEAPPGRVLALGEGLDHMPGTPVVEPVFGLPGRWIPQELGHVAEASGATVVDRVSLVVTHLSSVVTDHAASLLSREDVRVRNERLKEDDPSLVEELVPAVLGLGDIQRVLQALLEEQVPVRDLGRIYEALSMRAKTGTATEDLAEAARLALGDVIVSRCTDGGVLRVLTLDPPSEQLMVEGLRTREGGSQISLPPDQIEALMASLRSGVASVEEQGHQAALVCSPTIRPALRRLTVLAAPHLPVLSYAEVATTRVPIDTAGVVGIHAQQVSGGAPAPERE